MASELLLSVRLLAHPSLAVTSAGSELSSGINVWRAKSLWVNCIRAVAVRVAVTSAESRDINERSFAVSEAR